MSDELAGDPSGGGVSPQRKKISAAILILLLTVLAIELRAGLGHSMSGKALQAAAPEGVFEPDQVSQADVQGMLKLWPSETVLREGPDEIEYQYSWFSILRPLLSRPATNVYVSMLKGTPVTAIRFGTEGPSDAELEAARNPIVPSVEEMADDMGEMGMGGPGGPGGGGGERGGRPRGGREGAGGGGERQRPPIEGDAPAEDAPKEEASADKAPPEEAPADADAKSDEPAATEPEKKDDASAEN